MKDWRKFVCGRLITNMTVVSAINNAFVKLKIRYRSSMMHCIVETFPRFNIDLLLYKKNENKPTEKIVPRFRSGTKKLQIYRNSKLNIHFDNGCK
jgi:hypothetical protein